MEIPYVPGGNTDVSQSAAYQQYMQEKLTFSFAQDPFQAFFDLIALNMDVYDLEGISTSVNSLSKALEDIDWYTNQMTKIKKDFQNGPKQPGQTLSNDQQLRADVGALFNHLMQSTNAHLPQDGSTISISQFKNYFDALERPGALIDPILGPAVVKQIANAFKQGFDIDWTYDNGVGHDKLLSGAMTLDQLWQQAQSDPGVLQPYLAAMSTIESMTKGLSGSSTVTLERLSKQYMSVLYFLKTMFNDYYKMSKAPIGKEN
jgi:hypothetical protein